MRVKLMTSYRNTFEMQKWRFASFTKTFSVNGKLYNIGDFPDAKLRFVASVENVGIFVYDDDDNEFFSRSSLVAVLMDYVETVEAIAKSSIFINGVTEPVLVYEYKYAPEEYKLFMRNGNEAYVARVPFDVAKMGITDEIGFLRGSSWFGDKVHMFIDKPYQIYIGVKHGS